MSGTVETTQTTFVDLLANHLVILDNAAFQIDKNLNIKPDQFRCFARKAQRKALSAAGPSRRYADFIASYGCESAKRRRQGAGPDLIQNTYLRTMSGGGHQHFLGTMFQLANGKEEITTRQHLRNSLFHTWRRQDSRLGMRWDPEEDRRWALMAGDPSKGGGTTSERGANRMAVEAMPLFPTAVRGAFALETTGFKYDTEERATWFSWPIWEPDLGVDVVRSLVRLSSLQEPEGKIRHRRLVAMGIATVYRSHRITVGSGVSMRTNFTHGEEV